MVGIPVHTLTGILLLVLAGPFLVRAIRSMGSFLLKTLEWLEPWLDGLTKFVQEI